LINGRLICYLLFQIFLFFRVFKALISFLYITVAIYWLILYFFLELMSLKPLDLASYKEETYEFYLNKLYFIKTRFNFLV